MNAAEKIAGAYLRLNGFFLLPHFTVFDGESHNHVDFLALRPSDGSEKVNNLTFIRDDELDANINGTTDDAPVFIGALVEVRSNASRDLPSPEHYEYAKGFFGNGVHILKIAFKDGNGSISSTEDAIEITIKHALEFIFARIDWINQNVSHLTKTGSWNWSEESLSDLIYLNKFLSIIP